MSLNIIGISAHYHDAACCILQDGVLTAAVQEERFTRKKNDSRLPESAFLYCLEEASLSITDIHCIAYYEEPVKKLARQLWSGNKNIDFATFLNRDPNFVEKQLRNRLGYEGPIHYYSHHLSHAASSYYYSGFTNAATLTVDGVGEWATTTYGIANGKDLSLFEEVVFPDSIGLLYSAITSYLGFSVNSGEYKVMGLAPYGEARFADKIREMIISGPDGQYQLDLRYFEFLEGNKMYSSLLEELLGVAARKKDTKILQVHTDIAKSLQVVLEEILLEKAIYLHEKTGMENLCMAGGVALNCVANSRILKDGPFKKLFVQPAAGDAGCCLGAAALAHVSLSGEWMERRLEHVYLGPAYGENSIRPLLDAAGLKHQDFTGREDELLRQTAEKIAEGKVIGWFHGRLEFGPRSLGARSILADPRNPEMRDRINAMVKLREAFRPFAPAILVTEAGKFFDIDHASPFMLETCQVIADIALPAITHVDGSARVQTVTRETNAWFAGLLQAFYEITGCPVLLNTSFNVRDMPIVCSPEDALACFITTNIDCLVLENFFLEKEDLDAGITDLISSIILEKTLPELSPNVYTFI
ncbi:carbamoyltransferase [Chitinophaga sp.]|uniref:carbamoyltransferase family protein n=1 Tax=Chitinophaga sp. TaxID=1869181 RepID=UPI0031CFEB03